MKKSEFNNLMQDLAAAWTRRDHARVLQAFAENIHYSDPKRYVFKDINELRGFFEGSEVENQRCEMHATVFDEEQQLGAAEYSYEGQEKYHGLVLIKFVDDKISVWREYQHVDTRTWSDFISCKNTLTNA